MTARTETLNDDETERDSGTGRETVKSPKEWPEWANNLLTCKFFDKCGDHKELPKNMFCITCKFSICKHCLSNTTHCLHQGLQILKYVYQDVVRLQDIQKHLDSYKIKVYKINGEKAIHLKPRPQTKDTKPSSRSKGGFCCEACGRYIQDCFNRFCSIACKFIEVVEERVDEDANTTTDTSTTTNEEIRSPSLIQHEAKTCVFSSESSLGPNIPLKKRRRKATPHRALLF